MPQRACGFPNPAPITKFFTVLAVLLLTVTSSRAQSFPLASRIDYPAPSNPNGIAIGDLDGDGRLDLVTALRGASLVAVFPGLPGGRLGTPATFSTGSLPFSVALGDLNGDGRLDLAVANGFSNDVVVYLSR